MVKLRHLKTNELRPRKWLKVSTVGDKMQKLWGNGFQTMFYDLIRTSSLEGFSMPLHHYILLPLFLRKDFHYSENHKGLLVRKTNMVCLRVRSYNHSFKFSKRCGDDDSQAYSILWAIRLYLSLLYSLYSTVCLDWRKEEKNLSKHEFQSGKSCCQCPLPPTHYWETFCSISSHSGRLVT